MSVVLDCMQNLCQNPALLLASKKMFVVISNYGNESIALIQWAHDQRLDNVTVVNVDTGWSAPSWPAHVQHCKDWVLGLGMTPITLKPKVDFESLMRTQNGFPSRKFSWCANFLKALPILDWLDSPTVDPVAEATIVLARRRYASRVNFDLPEWIEEEEKLGDRKVWHPLYLHDNDSRNDLIEKANFKVMPHRSLECDPCINSDLSDVLRMDVSVLQRTALLENELNSHLLDPHIYHEEQNLFKAIQKLEKSPKLDDFEPSELFDMGCGNAFGCGL